MARISPTTVLRTLQTTNRQLQRQSRPFSIVARVRQLARSFEPHPYERYPVTMKAAKPDWGRQVRHLGDAAMFYFPMMGLLLGWPILAEQVLDGHIA